MSNESSNVFDTDFSTLNQEKGNITMSVTENNGVDKPQEVDNVSAWEKFPIECFPPVLQDFCLAVSKSTNTDPAYAGTFVLPVVASAVGSHIKLQLMNGWKVPAILWTLVVADSGSGKTHPLRLAVDPLEQEQRELDKLNEGAGKDDPLYFCLIGDTTTPALVCALADNLYGVCALHNEASGLLGSFDKRNKDESIYNDIYDGGSVRVTRKTSKRSIVAKHSHTSICGGIQPESLKLILKRNSQFLSSGFLARLLMCKPPNIPRRYSNESIPEEIGNAYGRMIRTLFSWRGEVIPTPDDPFLVKLTPEADKLFGEYFNMLEVERDALPSGILKAMRAKLIGYALRIALTLHVADFAAGCREGDLPTEIPDLEEGMMWSAMALTEWYKHEAERILQKTCPEIEVDQESIAILKHVEKRGQTDARTVSQNLRAFKVRGGTERAMEKLSEMVQRGLLTNDVQEATKGMSVKVYSLPCAHNVHNANTVPDESGNGVGAVGAVGMNFADRTNLPAPLAT